MTKYNGDCSLQLSNKGANDNKAEADKKLKIFNAK